MQFVLQGGFFAEYQELTRHVRKAVEPFLIVLRCSECHIHGALCYYLLQ